VSRVHQRYRRQTDRRAIAYSEHERKFTSADKTNALAARVCIRFGSSWVYGDDGGSSGDNEGMMGIMGNDRRRRIWGLRG